MMRNGWALNAPDDNDEPSEELKVEDIVTAAGICTPSVAADRGWRGKVPLWASAVVPDA